MLLAMMMTGQHDDLTDFVIYSCVTAVNPKALGPV